MRRRFPLALATALVLLTASPAVAIDHMLRWTHPTPELVDGFRIHYGDESGTWTQIFALPIKSIGREPYPTGNGAAEEIFVYLLNLPDYFYRELVVAVTAYRGDPQAPEVESPLSNLKFIEPNLTPPGRPILVTP